MIKKQELAIQEQINPIIARVSHMSINTPEDMVSATSELSQLNVYLDKMTEEKEKLTRPINEALKEIRSRYKPTELLLDEAIATIKKKMGSYQQKALAEQQKAEQKIADKVASGYIKIDTAIKKLENIDTVDEKITTDAGAVSFRTVQKFECMDVVMLAEEDGGFFVTPNDTKIREAMKNGRTLKGVRYFEEQSVWNKRN